MTPKVSLCIVDARPVRRMRLAKSLEALPDFEIAGSFALLADALKSYVALAWDVILFDGDQSDEEGFHALERAFRDRNLPLVPIWRFPQCAADTFREQMLGNVEETFGLEEEANRLDLLADTLKSAAKRRFNQTKMGKNGDRHQKLAPIPFVQNAVAIPKANVGQREMDDPNPAPRNALIAIGASTGGVKALETILSAANENTPPILIVQHMPADFLVSFCDRLNAEVSVELQIAKDGDIPQPGCAYVAPGSRFNMVVESVSRMPIIRLQDSAPLHGHRPSVDRLFQSLVPFAPSVQAALLTGMGVDGAQGLLELKTAGAWTAAQSQKDCTVFGMPRAAIEMGAADEVLPLPELASAILRFDDKAAPAPVFRSQRKRAS